MAFSNAFMGGSQVLGADAEREIRQKEMGFKSRKLDLDIAQQEFAMTQHRHKVAKEGLDQAVKTFEGFANTVANMPAIKPGSAMDQALHTQKGIVAKFLELNQQDPNAAEAMYQNALAGVGQAIKPMNVGMGGQVINPATGEVLHHNPVQKAPEGEDVLVRRYQGLRRIGFSDEEAKTAVGAVPSESGFTVETVPGQYGTETRISQGSGRGRRGMTAEGAAAVAGAAPPDGEGGKPLPKDAQENLTGAFASLNALRTINENIDRTGFARGLRSEAEAFLGTDSGAVDFETARNNLKVQAQALIKGIPSNFDVQTFINTLPKLVGAQEVQKSRAKFSTQIAEQLIKDTIGYYKYTGHRIPKEVLEQAKTFGIDMSTTPVWDGKGTATTKSEALLKEARKGGEAKTGKDFGGMSASQLNSVDPNSLSEEELNAWRKAADDIIAKKGKR